MKFYCGNPGKLPQVTTDNIMTLYLITLHVWRPEGQIINYSWPIVIRRSYLPPPPLTSLQTSTDGDLARWPDLHTGHSHLVCCMVMGDWHFLFTSQQTRYSNHGNPLPAKLFYLYVRPLEVASRYRDPQLKWENPLARCRFNSFTISAGTVFIRQNLTSVDGTVFIRENLTSVDVIWRIKTIPALLVKELNT